jgi:NitT/TauT family transport system permease protein
MARYLKPVALLAILLIVWQVASDIFEIPWFILPSPLQILAKLAGNYERLLHHTWITLMEVFAGFALAIVGGMIFAILIVYSRFLEESLYPLLVMLQVTPQVAIAPVLVIWFGSSYLPKILVAFLVAFFPMVVNTAAGLMRVPEELLDLMNGFKVSKAKVFLLIRLPNALPYIFAGMRISITLSVIGAVVGEFVAASEGLGYVVFTGTANLDTPLTFAAIFILATMGIVLFWLVGVVRNLLLPWAPEREQVR